MEQNWAALSGYFFAKDKKHGMTNTWNGSIALLQYKSAQAFFVAVLLLAI